MPVITHMTYYQHEELSCFVFMHSIIAFLKILIHAFLMIVVLVSFLPVKGKERFILFFNFLKI